VPGAGRARRRQLLRTVTTRHDTRPTSVCAKWRSVSPRAQRPPREREAVRQPRHPSGTQRARLPPSWAPRSRAPRRPRQCQMAARVPRSRAHGAHAPSRGPRSRRQLRTHAAGGVATRLRSPRLDDGRRNGRA
jgi:hypothetical protein